MKFLIFFIHAITIALYQFFFGHPVTLVAKVPDHVSSGKIITMEVTISKVEIAKFAILQLELPSDFTATESDSKGGSFTASGNIVKIIWASIPSDSELTVKVNIAIPASSKGDKQIQGKFSFLENNIKQQAELVPVSFNLSSDVATPFSESESVLVSANRKVTPLASSNGFQVDVLIKKGNIKGFAQLVEKIPAGYKAENISTADGASFDFTGDEAKFIWMSVPTDGEIKVSYKLVPTASASVQKPDYNKEGSTFSYVENRHPKKIAINTK